MSGLLGLLEVALVELAKIVVELTFLEVVEIIPEIVSSLIFGTISPKLLTRGRFRRHSGR